MARAAWPCRLRAGVPGQRHRRRGAAHADAGRPARDRRRLGRASPPHSRRGRAAWRKPRDCARPRTRRRAAAGRRSAGGGAPHAHDHVLRSRRLDGLVGRNRSGRLSRVHRIVPPRARGGDPPVRRLYRAVFRRRPDGLFRIPAILRLRRRESRHRRARDHRHGEADAAVRRPRAAGPDRHCDRPDGGRGRGQVARVHGRERGRGSAEPRRAPPGRRGAEHGRRRRRDPPVDRRRLRLQRPRRVRAEGFRPAGAGLAGSSPGERREPVRRPSHRTPGLRLHRSRGRDGAAWGKPRRGACRPRPVRHHFGRGGARKVAACAAGSRGRPARRRPRA